MTNSNSLFVNFLSPTATAQTGTKRHATLALLSLALLASIIARPTYAQPSPEPLWDSYDAILATHISNGRVNYRTLATSAPFKSFMTTLKQQAQQAEGKFSDNVAKKHSSADNQRRKDIIDREKAAFFINAYNALTLELILNNMPLSSIKDIGGWFSSPWNIALLDYQGAKISLNDIEHKILRPMGEPRIHFAINCASISCPPLRAEAYRASRLNEQLQDQQLQFINSPAGVQLDGTKIRVSKIFDWFEEDWGSKENIHSMIRASHAKGETISGINGYLKYNWQLNEAK